MPARDATPFNILIVAQGGRLQYEALLFVASLAQSNPKFPGKVIVAEPQAGPLWSADPGIRNDDIRARITDLGGTIVPLQSEVFGGSYPYGNKIEALKLLPKGEPFVFFDSDTLILDDLMTVPFDFDRPTASNRCEGTWPVIELYGPGYEQIWSALYHRFGLDFESSQDHAQPREYWRRYLYFNAGWFFYRCPHEFGELFLDFARSIRDDPPAELICQPLDPWLDQVALPLVIHALGGGRDTLPGGFLDGSVSCHYRNFPLLYAREDQRVLDALSAAVAPNKTKKLLKLYDPIRKLVLQGKGQKVRGLFDQSDLPTRERAIRNQIRRAGLWMV